MVRVTWSQTFFISHFSNADIIGEWEKALACLSKLFLFPNDICIGKKGLKCSALAYSYHVNLDDV